MPNNTELIKKNFEAPDETKQFPGAKVEAVAVGDIEVRRFTVEPGWVWSDSVGPSAGTDSCQLEHVIWMVISGRFAVQMDDGTTIEFGPGDIGAIPPGHDAWVVGDDVVIGIDVLAGGIDST